MSGHEGFKVKLESSWKIFDLIISKQFAGRESSIPEADVGSENPFAWFDLMKIPRNLLFVRQKSVIEVRNGRSYALM